MCRFFNQILRKQIRNLPKILNFVKKITIFQNYSLHSLLRRRGDPLGLTDLGQAATFSWFYALQRCYPRRTSYGLEIRNPAAVNVRCKADTTFFNVFLNVAIPFNVTSFLTWTRNLRGKSCPDQMYLMLRTEKRDSEKLWWQLLLSSSVDIWAEISEPIHTRMLDSKTKQMNAAGPLHGSVCSYPR